MPRSDEKEVPNNLKRLMRRRTMMRTMKKMTKMKK